MIRKNTFIIFFLFSICIYGKEGSSQKVIVKYKQYESFDLGNLEIEGRLIAPGDLSVSERKRKSFYRDLYIREDFSREIKKDIENIR